MMSPHYYIDTLNPFAFGPIRWYSLAYIAGCILGFFYARYQAQKFSPSIQYHHLESLLNYFIVGMILGGRLGEVLFYNPQYYMHHILEIFQLWNGGMSFHGGILGATISIFIGVRRNQLQPLIVADLVAAAVPIGLFLGRLANFANGELWGTPSTVPWAVIFPQSYTMIPRHPSQIYEALTEGLLLFVLIFLLSRYTTIRQYPGKILGVFLLGYACARIACETFRQPEVLNILTHTVHMTWGQILSLPMIPLGLYFLFTSTKDLQNNATKS